MRLPTTPPSSYSTSIPPEIVNRVNHVVTSGVWHNHAFFYTTPTEVRVIFPHEQDIFPLLLCSFSLEATVVDIAEKDRPAEVMYRPPGFITIAAVKEPFALILVDSTSYRCYSIPIGFSLLQFLMNAQAGRIQDALLWTDKIDPSFHNQLARFLVVRGYTNEAAHLSGLSASTQFSIATKFNLSTAPHACYAKSPHYTHHQQQQDEDGEDENARNLRYDFEDFFVADACVGLGRSTPNMEMSSLAFRTATDTVLQTCASLQSCLPDLEKGEIAYLKELWKNKMNLLAPDLVPLYNM